MSKEITISNSDPTEAGLMGQPTMFNVRHGGGLKFAAFRVQLDLRERSSPNPSSEDGGGLRGFPLARFCKGANERVSDSPNLH